MRGPKTSLKTISLKSPPGRGQDARAHMSAGTGSGSQMFCLKDFAPSFEARMNSVVGIHTHPVGERVSSADLVTAIKLHPEMNRQNKRRLTVRGIGDMRRANLLGDRQFLDLVGIMLL